MTGNELRIELPDKPIPLKRARTGNGRFYDPQGQVKANLIRYIKYELKIDMKPIDVGIQMEYGFAFQMPKSWSKKKKAAMDGMPNIQKPDCSNMIKFYEDCFNGVLFVDDCLIYRSTEEKWWDTENKTIIKIRW